VNRTTSLASGPNESMVLRPSLAVPPVRASPAVNEGLRSSGYGASPPVLAPTPLGLARARAIAGRYPETSCRRLVASRNRCVVQGPPLEILLFRRGAGRQRLPFLKRRVSMGMHNISMQRRTSGARLLSAIRKEPKQARTLAGHPEVPGGWARVLEPGSVAPEGAKHTDLVRRHVQQ